WPAPPVAASSANITRAPMRVMVVFLCCRWSRWCGTAAGGSMAVLMGVLFVVLDLVAGDVPAAIAAGGGFFVAGIAVERAALEELFQAVLVLGRQIARVFWQRHRVAAALALAQ